MIELRNVSLLYPGPNSTSTASHAALKGIQAQWPKGAFVLVEGHSGAGKSSVLRLRGTFTRPSSGDVLVSNSSITGLSGLARAHYRRSVGYTGQDVPLLTQLNGFDNVALPLRLAGLPAKDIHTRVHAALAKVGLAHTDRMFPNELSGGQQLRLQIARAVVNRPALVLVDEPTAQLDDASAQRVVDLLEEFNRAGVTVVVASHEAKYFPKTSHRLRLQDGVMVA